MADMMRRAVKSLDGARTNMPLRCMPWLGVRVDAGGQNPLYNPVVPQVSGDAHRTIWPFDIAAAGVGWAPNG